MKSEILDLMRRRFVQNFLDQMILLELRKRSMNGYDIITFVNNKFHISVRSGTVYSYLYFLERKTLIKGELTQRGRVSMLTEKGKENIKTFINAKDTILKSILDLFEE